MERASKGRERPLYGETERLSEMRSVLWMRLPTCRPCGVSGSETEPVATAEGDRAGTIGDREAGESATLQ